MGLHKAIELVANSIVTLHEVFQTMLSIVLILIEAPRDDFSEREAMGGGNKEGL